MICQACGIEAPTKYVSFHQNVGALVVRFSKSTEGQLCKSCIHKHFWSMTGTTFVLGWWGTISFVITPFFLLNNTIRYITCLGMARVPTGAHAPVLTNEAVERIEPHAQFLFDRLDGGDPLERVAAEVAEMSGVTPGEVVLYVHEAVQGESRE
ncbi:MAG: hypothetical protein HY040_06600 [Planctomycetes bacterium]|nr:hypothetical protein [Planctomycetota bacterium]